MLQVRHQHGETITVPASMHHNQDNMGSKKEKTNKNDDDNAVDIDVEDTTTTEKVNTSLFPKTWKEYLMLMVELSTLMALISVFQGVCPAIPTIYEFIYAFYGIGAVCPIVKFIFSFEIYAKLAANRGFNKKTGKGVMEAKYPFWFGLSKLLQVGQSIVAIWGMVIVFNGNAIQQGLLSPSEETCQWLVFLPAFIPAVIFALLFLFMFVGLIYYVITKCCYSKENNDKNDENKKSVTPDDNDNETENANDDDKNEIYELDAVLKTIINTQF